MTPIAMEEYDREIRRRLWRHRMRVTLELIGEAVGIIGIFAIGLAMLLLTPEQRSAEADYCAAQLEAAGEVAE